MQKAIFASFNIKVKKIETSINCLCIPRVLSSITEKQIKNIFDSVKIGIIDRIDIVGKKGDKHNRVFIHIKKWFITENAIIAQERFQNNQDIKIIYEDPWFWKISVYKKTKNY